MTTTNPKARHILCTLRVTDASSVWLSFYLACHWRFFHLTLVTNTCLCVCECVCWLYVCVVCVLWLWSDRALRYPELYQRDLLGSTGCAHDDGGQMNLLNEFVDPVYSSRCVFRLLPTNQAADFKKYFACGQRSTAGCSSDVQASFLGYYIHFT